MSLNWFEDRDWSYLKVTGADRVDFFFRLTTNRLPKPGEALVHTFFLSVTAKVLAEFWVGAEDESLSLFTPTLQVDAARENIDRYHFGEKLSVSQPPGALFVVVGASDAQLQQLGERAAYAAKPDPRYGADAVWFFVEEAETEAFRTALGELGTPLESLLAETLRIATGRPRFGLDYTSDTLFLEMAQQTDFSESKGCYPGQEIVARVLHRGRLNRHLRAFTSAAEIPTTWLMSQDGKEMARVTSSIPGPDGGSRGFLYVRREAGPTGADLKGLDSEGREFTLTVCARAEEVLTGEPA